MSRSRKKTPITGITTATSEKQDKRIANRRERRINRIILQTTGDETQLRLKREISNVWAFDKDGKRRFDPRKYPKSMRK
jgi:hypothetical protein